MKRIEPDNHLTALPTSGREDPSGDEDAAPQLPESSRSTEGAQQAISDRGLSRNTPSQPARVEATVTTGTESHGMVRPQHSVLFSILDQEGELETSRFPAVLRLLHQLQDEFNLKHRFHLFVESVEKATDEGAVRESSTMCPVFTRVAFSPTLSPSDQDQKTRLAYVCQKITEFSFGKMPNTSSRASPPFMSSPIGDTPRIPRQSFPSVTVPEQQGIDTSHAAWPLRIYENLTFPSWCPCQAKEYTTPPQASEERLFITRSVLERFIELEDFQVMWIYQELFKFLYRHGRKNRVSGMARTLTYSQFTPPWIRRQIAIEPDNPQDANGDHVAEAVTLRKRAITHLRNERNIQGYRRVRFLLTAFFCHEPDTIKPLIQHLFQTVPSIRAVTRRKTSKKRNHPNEKLQPGCNGRSTKRVDSGLERTRPASSTTQPEGSTSAVTNEQRSEGRQSSAETTEIQQSPQLLNTVLPPSTSNVRLGGRTHGRTNIRSPSRSTTRASSANNRASTPTPFRLLSFRTHVGSSREEQNTEQQKRNSVFNGIPYDPSPLKEGTQPESNQSSLRTRKEEAQKPSNLAEKTSEHQENTENPSTPFTPPAESLLPPGLPPRLREEEEIIVKQLRDNGEDEEDLIDPRDGIIKCGALARCIYILNHFMQSEKEVDGNCKRCNYKMHKRCVALHTVCDKCIKHSVFSQYTSQISERTSKDRKDNKVAFEKSSFHQAFPYTNNRFVLLSNNEVG